MKKFFSSNISGQGLVEFALVLPILLLILFGIVDLGRFIYHSALINQVSKETARMVSLAKDINSVSKAIKNTSYSFMGASSSLSLDGTDNEGNPCSRIVVTSVNGSSITVDITPKFSTIKAGDIIRVHTVYTMKYITPIAVFLGSSAKIECTYYITAELQPA